MLTLRVDLHKRLLEELNLAAIDKVSESELKAEIAAVVREELHTDWSRPLGQGTGQTGRGAGR